MNMKSIWACFFDEETNTVYLLGFWSFGLASRRVRVVSDQTESLEARVFNVATEGAENTKDQVSFWQHDSLKFVPFFYFATINISEEDSSVAIKLERFQFWRMLSMFKNAGSNLMDSRVIEAAIGIKVRTLLKIIPIIDIGPALLKNRRTNTVV